MTAAMLYAEAALKRGLYAQAFPEFGAERRGTPVRAYTRISAKPILVRGPVTSPDIVVVLDFTLSERLYLEGLKTGGILVVNSKRPMNEVVNSIGRKDVRLARVDATRIALEALKAPFVNVAMLGALAKALPLISLEHIEEAIRAHFARRVAELNVVAMRRAYEETEVG